MGATDEGVLEKGYWDAVKAKENPQESKGSQLTEWAVEFFKPAVFTKPSGRENTSRRRTAYLDGLRGFAAFLVYWGHHQLWAHEIKEPELIYENVWNYEGRRYFVTLPGIRLFFSGGHFAVTIFFVISGYVLSAKPLQLIQAGDYLKLGDNLSSALFRRWLRLHLPVFATTFLYLLFFQLVWNTAYPARKSSLTEEIWFWWIEIKNFTFVFRTGGEPWFGYNFHTWSIPVEFKGSIAIYTALAAFSRCTRNARLWLELGLMFYFMYIVDGWYCSAFTAGMLLCDLDLLALDNNLPEFFERLSPYKKYFNYALLFCGVYLGGSPSHSADLDALRRSPGWRWLSHLKPQAVYDYKWFYLFWGATFVVASIPRIPWLKAFFENRFNQYMGRISFGFYLVHGPILWTLGERLYAATGFTRESNAASAPEWINYWPLPRTGPLGLEPAFIAPHLILLPLTFWLAELVTKLIDEPSVRFAQWLYQATLAPAIKL